jgi:2-polyprenyl-6-methoxyphenol hydroxylase-like FAD-dependent oxidoreductase
MAMPRPDDVRWGAMVVGAQAKAGLIPLSKSDMYLLLVTQEDPSVFLPVDQLDQILRDRLAGFGGLIKELAALIVDPAQVVYRPMQIVMLPEPWHSGRILLIGDAAHASTPHLGQGAAMAIEDAVVFGELIGKQLPWVEVTKQYMSRRFARAMHIQNASFEVGEYEQGRRPNLNVVSVIDEAKAAAAAAI